MKKPETALYIPQSLIEDEPKHRTVDNRGRVYVGKKRAGKTYKIVLIKIEKEE